MWSQLASIALALCSLSLVAAQRCVDQVHHEQQALSPRVDYAACGPAVCATDGYCYRLFHNICYLNAFNVRLLFAGQRALVQADIRHCLPEPRWLDYNTPYDPRLPGSSYVNAGAYETPYLYESEDLEPSYPRSYAPYLYYKAQDTYSPINGFYYRNMREYVTQRKPKPSTSYRKPKAKCTTTASPITASTTVSSTPLSTTTASTTPTTTSSTTASSTLATSTTTASTAAPSTTSTTVATTTPSTTSTTTASTTTPSTTSTTVSTTTPSTTSTTVSTTTPSTTSTTTSSTTTPSTTSTTAASTTTASTSTVSTTTPSTTSPSTTSTTTPSTTSTTTPSTTPITIASTTPSTTTVTTTTASTTPPTTIASTPPTTTILSLLQSAAGAAQSPIPSTTNLPDILSTTQSTTATTATSPQTTLTTSSSVTTASTSSTPPATTASTAAPTTASIDLDDNTLVSLVFTMPNGRVFRLSMASQITDPTTGNKTCAEETQLELRYRGISEPLRFTGCIYNNSTRNGTSYGTTTTRRPTPKPYYSPSRSVDYRPVGYLYSITYGSAYEAPYASGPAPPQYRADPAPPRYGYGPRPGNTRFRVHASASASADLPYYD